MSGTRPPEHPPVRPPVPPPVPPLAPPGPAAAGPGDGCLTLPGLTLPDATGLARRLPFLSAFRTDDPALRDRYDRRTLVYGGVQMPRQGLLRLTAPRLLNLRAVARRATYTADDMPLPPPRIRDFRRYSTLEFDLAQPCRVLRIRHGDWRAEMPVETADPAAFAGLNVLYTMSRNNDPDWICDWVRYHHSAHGANALVLVDNASDAYSLEALEAALQSLGVLRTLRIISAPFRHGLNSAICRRASETRFLQPALINLTRDLLLQDARAVLVCDIDELVVSRTGESIFDHGAAHPLGYVRFPGYWRFPEAGQTAPPRHRDHVWQSTSDSAPCPAKYVAVPGGPLGTGSWMVHNLEGRKAARYITTDFWFAHCRDISTNWKSARTGSGSADRVPDAALRDHFARHLP